VSSDEVEAIEREEDRMAGDAKEGCRESRNALFLRSTEPIRRLEAPARRLLLRTVSYRRLANPAIELEDIHQQAFLVFCKVLDEWNPGVERFEECLTRRMPGYLLHYVRDTLRYSSRERESIPDHEPVIADDDAAIDGLPDYALSLPPTLEQAVRLRYVDGLSCEGIARLVRRNRSTVTRRLGTALALMRDEIQESWEAV